MESSILQNVPSNGLEIEEISSKTIQKYSIVDKQFLYISKTERQKKYKI